MEGLVEDRVVVYGTRGRDSWLEAGEVETFWCVSPRCNVKVGVLQGCALE